MFRLAITGQLLITRVRRNVSGTASMLLVAKGYRDIETKARVVLVSVLALIAVLVVGEAVLFGLVWLWPPLGLLAIVGTLWVSLWAGIRLVRVNLRCRAARLRLKALRPPKPYWLIVSMCSMEPGEGAKLLRQVTAEADRKKWVLALEAANGKLVSYYERFGFSPHSPSESMPWLDAAPAGDRTPCVVTCMVRRPAERPASDEVRRPLEAERMGRG